MLPHAPHGFHELGRLGDLDATCAAHRNRLQVLRAHHSADAGATGSAVLIVDDAGEADELLARRTDVRHAQARDAQLVTDAVLGFAGGAAPVSAGVADLDDVIVA